MEVSAVYPGSFDPITNGHLDVIRKALNLVDNLTIAVGNTLIKESLFSTKEKLSLINQSLIEYKLVNKKINVLSFNTTLAKFIKDNNKTLIIRGLRGYADYDVELQMAKVNKVLSNIETIFLPSLLSEKEIISSSMVKEICYLKGDISNFVPLAVKKKLENKFFSNKTK